MKITKEKEIHLRVWPDRDKTGKRGGYFDVHIFPTRNLWIAAQKENRSGASLRKVGATVFLPARTIGRCYGHAYFYHSQFFDGAVAHECTHIGIEYCRRKGLNPSNSVDEEEALARYVGDSHLQIFNALRHLEGRRNEVL